MGRRSGVRAEETRRELLDAAIAVLRERGYEGTRVSEIAARAGVTSGALYNHFASKADLLEAAISEHAPDLVTSALQGGEIGSVIDALRAAGTALPEHSVAMGPLLVELIATATRDDEIAKVVGRSVTDRERLATDVVRLGQDGGEIDPAIDAEALSRFVTLVALGSLVAAALDLKPVDDDAWRSVIDRTLEAARPPVARRSTARTPHEPQDPQDPT